LAKGNKGNNNNMKNLDEMQQKFARRYSIDADASLKSDTESEAPLPPSLQRFW
jgi:hypothetical protein